MEYRMMVYCDKTGTYMLYGQNPYGSQAALELALFDQDSIDPHVGWAGAKVENGKVVEIGHPRYDKKPPYIKWEPFVPQKRHYCVQVDVGGFLVSSVKFDASSDSEAVKQALAEDRTIKDAIVTSLQEQDKDGNKIREIGLW